VSRGMRRGVIRETDGRGWHALRTTGSGGTGVSPVAASVGLHAAAILLLGGVAVFGYRAPAVPSVDVVLRDAASSEEALDPFEPDLVADADPVPPLDPVPELRPEPIPEPVEDLAPELEDPVPEPEPTPAEEAATRTGVPPEAWRGARRGPLDAPTETVPDEAEVPPADPLARAEVPADPSAPADRRDPDAARVAPAPDPTNPPPEYPIVARRRGLEGMVRVRVRVAVDGSPLATQVLESSGHRVLDDVAVRTARSWRYVPAREGGAPVEGSVDLPFRFRLEP